MSVSS
jgi:hypothetical protein